MVYDRANGIRVPAQRRQLRIGVVPLELLNSLLSNAEDVSDVLLGEPCISSDADEVCLHLSVCASEDLRARADSS